MAAAAGRNPAVVRVSDAPPASASTTSNAAAATGAADTAEGGGVDPPPAYSRTDPEPEATRMLEMQLNQVARSGNGSGTVAVDGQDLAREERERREMEEAMRESEELEATRRRRYSNVNNHSADRPEGGAYRARRQSSHSITNLSPRPSGLSLAPAIDVEPVGMDVDSPEDPSRPRAHRRAVSEAGGDRAGEPMGALSGLENGMRALATNPSDASQPPRPQLASQRGTSNNPFLNPPLSPGGAVSPSAASRASNNPFLDPPQQQRTTPQSPSTNTPLQRAASNAGSVHTVYAPPPGPPPAATTATSTPATPGGNDAATYAPPPGPPPGHISAGLVNLPRRDPFEILSSYDTVILVDDSGSMAGGRWREAQKALMEVAETASAYDRDGIDVHFMNDTKVGQGLTVSQRSIASDCHGLTRAGVIVGRCSR